MSSVLASEKFTCINLEGERFDVCIELTTPKAIEMDEEHSVHFECEIFIVPSLKSHVVYGENAFQSLCMALGLIRKILRSFVADGGRIYWRDTNHPVDINSPWFEPMVRLL